MASAFIFSAQNGHFFISFCSMVSSGFCSGSGPSTKGVIQWGHVRAVTTIISEQWGHLFILANMISAGSNTIPARISRSSIFVVLPFELRYTLTLLEEPTETSLPLWHCVSVTCPSMSTAIFTISVVVLFFRLLWSSYPRRLSSAKSVLSSNNFNGFLRHPQSSDLFLLADFVKSANTE